MSSYNFHLSQYKLYRKYKGGSWYLIYNWVVMPFWSNKIITSCGGRAIEEEHYPVKK